MKLAAVTILALAVVASGCIGGTGQVNEQQEDLNDLAENSQDQAEQERQMMEEQIGNLDEDGDQSSGEESQ